ncbi:WD repeat-containing protein 89 isoform X2 [Ambystoma mexicanum]|uniref:WD repeat-containing protein 89 isoform X2 n=1 Tax=Ambystoma mexicanum TaxID=8296 RepID=UPI0037E8C60A
MLFPNSREQRSPKWPRGSYKSCIYTMETSSEPTKPAMDKIQDQFDNFHIEKRSTLTIDSTYLMDMDVSKPQEAGQSQFLAILCSDNSIKVYNRDTLTLIREYNGDSGLLNGIRFARTSENLLFSASVDGTVKSWDTRLSSSETAQLFKGFPSNVFTSFDISCNDTLVCAGTEKTEDEVFMVFWDARNAMGSPASKQPLGVYSESHNDDITQVCFHPSNPNLLVSGSTDGLVNVFDLNKQNEDDALIVTCNSDSSVSFVGWSGKAYNQIYCLTHDEGFYWWDLDQLDSQCPITLLNIQDSREKFNTGYGNLEYLTGGFYNPKSDMLFVLGGTHTGTLHLLNGQTDGLHHWGTLQGGHSSTLRSFYWNHEEQSLLTGGEDGQLLLWKPRTVEMCLQGRNSMKMTSSVHQRVRIHNKSTKLKK